MAVAACKPSILAVFAGETPVLWAAIATLEGEKLGLLYPGDDGGRPERRERDRPRGFPDPMAGPELRERATQPDGPFHRRVRWR